MSRVAGHPLHGRTRQLPRGDLVPTAALPPPLSRGMLIALSIGLLVVAVPEIGLAAVELWIAANTARAAPRAALAVLGAAAALGGFTLLYCAFVMTRVFCGRQRQPTRFRHYLTGAQLTVGMIGIAVSWLGDPTASLTSYLAALHAIAMAPIPSALGPRSRIWPTPPDGTLGNRGQPYRRPAAGDAGTPYFVATLTATRSWLYGVLCYSPHMGCWLFYWPSRTHCYLIEGPHNPALRDPGAIDAAQQWAAVFLDEEHALNSLLATDSTRPVTSVTEWIAIEWNGRPCWVPLFADTDLCSLPISARHDNTGTLHHCRCRHANAAMTCEPTTLAGRRSAEKDHDGPAC